MQKIIKDRDIVEDNLKLLDKDFAGDIVGNNVIAPKAYWLQHATQCEEAGIGVWLDSDEGPEELQAHLRNIPVIAINFPAVGDGRGYSYARILREQMGYTREIRAIGAVKFDQLQYLKRCGFNAFLMAEGQDIDVALSALDEITESYQAACDQSLPLFRRRSA